MDWQPPAVIYPRDLRLRVVAVIGSLLAISTISRGWPAVIGLFAIVCLYAASRQPVPWRRFIHPEVFLILLFLTLPFTQAGTPFFHSGPFSATIEGVERTLLLACKILSSVMLISLFFAATDTLRLGMALRGLYLPEKLVQLLIMVVRYLALIQAEFARLQDAMRMRAFTPRASLHSWRCYGFLVGMLLVRALERAERVEEAMRMRNFTGYYPHTDDLIPTGADWAATVGLVCGAVVLSLVDKV